jgi:large subunit ribosomal protein L15
MQLHSLKSRAGSRHRVKRLGKGESSGLGKTSGRGGKGQTARSGSSIRPGFEGGQMPLIRRIPKRGFNNIRFATIYSVVNLCDLNQFDEGTRVDETLLRAHGLVRGTNDGVKVLATGELTKKITVVADKFSAAAQQKIEAAGGVCEVAPARRKESKAKACCGSCSCENQ